MKGTYCLVIAIEKPIRVKIGSIYDDFSFSAGSYIYIGSAMNSLIPRIRRHLAKNKKIHWHIDYLLADENVSIKEVIFNISDEKIECKLAEIISKSSDHEIDKFGSSDCNCNSHLIYLKSFKNGLSKTKNAYKSLKKDYHDLNYFKKLDSKN